MKIIQFNLNLTEAVWNKLEELKKPLNCDSKTQVIEKAIKCLIKEVEKAEETHLRSSDHFLSKVKKDK